MAEAWKEKFGRSHYEFVYRDVLFLSLNSEDVPGHEPGTIALAIGNARSYAAERAARAQSLLLGGQSPATGPAGAVVSQLHDLSCIDATRVKGW